MNWRRAWKQLALTTCAVFGVQGAECSEWAGWIQYRDALMEPSGRIVDPGDARKITTSEGQSYGLFFALVAGDRKSFDLILKWTEDNLSRADLTSNLPAWLWGKKDSGEWAVIDSNAASDADVLIAYTLLEAGRLWHIPRYEALGKLLARRILKDEVKELPGLGPVLLPGPVGFELKAGERWKLNPSYLQPSILKALAVRHPGSIWSQVYRSSVRILQETATKGFAPDWVEYRAKEGFQPDEKDGVEGSYNAIRVYMWVGLMDKSENDSKLLAKRFAPMAEEVKRQGVPPRVVNAQTGALVDGTGPVGFSAAVIPLLRALDEKEALQSQVDRLIARPPARDAYYDHSLTLFGQGAVEGRFAFQADGSLITAWQHCKPSLPR
ncbi:cellulase [Burkholderiaceae bacterium DAT-1]|nr:cellulase [Burkholderiaceae bacterium DAT-1]